MKPEVSNIDDVLNRHFLKHYPIDAAKHLESMAILDILPVISYLPAGELIPVWTKLVPSFAATLTTYLPSELARDIISQMAPDQAVKILFQMDKEVRSAFLEALEKPVQDEINELMSYPENTAGRLMDTRIPTYRGTMTVDETLNSLRSTKMRTARSLYIVDSEGKITHRLSLQDLALGDPKAQLSSLSTPVQVVIPATASHEQIAEIFSENTFFDLPVVDVNGVLLGVIVNANLMQTVQEDTTADIQTMVGVSREERALSSSSFAVKKRMPWLQINLLTAFLAAAVVGLFESTIAQFTALAILLPVVAGQSGNAGAQALAVTMRGLALREITSRHLLTVMLKEIRVGFLNGIGIAITCGIGVYFWSGSLGLVVVICISMVMAMTAAGFAGAIVPIMLVRLGQDPAQASSIILTTVTDVAGFFSFLGIASLLMSYL